MVITKHGPAFIKIQFGDTVLAFNPPSSESDKKSARFGADVALSSVKHSDFLGGELLTAGDKEPFVIDGPGEYEVGGVFIKGLPSVTNYKGEQRINTVYVVELEDMNICFLGALDVSKLEGSTAEAIDEVDILFVPVGGDGVLDPADAYKLAVTLEANVIIPIFHNGSGDDEAVTAFLKEAGEKAKPVDKLTLKRRDVSGEEGAIKVLTVS